MIESLMNATEFGQRDENTSNNEKKLVFCYPNFSLSVIIEIIALINLFKNIFRPQFNA